MLTGNPQSIETDIQNGSRDTRTVPECRLAISTIFSSWSIKLVRNYLPVAVCEQADVNLAY